MISRIAVLLILLHAVGESRGFLQPRNGLWITRQIVRQSLEKKEVNPNRFDANKRRVVGRRTTNGRDVDSVVGAKMSTISGESDFGLDSKATEARWLDSVSSDKKEVFIQTARGLDMLRELELDGAAEAFDRVFELNPSAYLWQAGIVKYYRDELREAAGILARSVVQSESRFGLPASEERIWRDACQIKYLGTLPEDEREALSKQIEDVFPKPREPDPMDGTSTKESRKVFRIAKDLFSSSAREDQVGVALGRAKLRALSGALNKKAKMDKKMWKLCSWYYLGLHYDALGEEKDSKECMQMATRLCPTSSTVDDIMYSLPKLHLKARNWCEESTALPYEEAVATLDVIDASNTNDPNPLILTMIQKSILKMDDQQLQDALRTKGLETTGSEETLRCRLLDSLVDDIDLET